MRKRFAERCRQILIGLWEEDPVEATYLGIHNFDSLLSRTDAQSRRAYHQQRQYFLDGLEEFERRRDELSAGEQMDLDLLRSHLKVTLFADDNFRTAERRADRYPSECLFGIYLPAMRNFAPLDERAASMRDRLREAPRLLAEGIENLRKGDNIPAVWTEIGTQVTNSGIAFFDTLVPQLANDVPDLHDDLLAANDSAREAMNEYSDFLRRELLPASTGDFAVGREAFEFLLREAHHLPYDADDLREIGEEMVVSTQQQLDSLAKKIDSGSDWRTTVHSLKEDHPAPGELLDVYRQQMSAARHFVEERELVTVPADQVLHVVETPVFERPTIPYAAFVPPAPFEKEQEGIFWVTPVDTTVPAEQQEEQLQGHCSWSIPFTALHEGFPGHHLQFCHANKVDSPVRRQLSTSVFIEGWALYCEEMMREQGFVSDSRNVLMQLKDQLWRACRVVIDVGLHCFGMSFEQGVEMLVDVAGLEPANAVSEIRRYTQTPTQPMSYLIGKREILNLIAEFRQSAGNSFELKTFHDRLLSFGSIPVSLIRRAMIP